MLNCKLRVVVLSVGECNHMGLKGFRGLESVTGDAGVTRGPGARFSKLPVITRPVKRFCFPF